ncbi:hypothetical protein Pen01_43950 [Phytomonospora endophytica]|nr:hypothetical protein Pen01_43950 [Phytomonospora endophytica]
MQRLRTAKGVPLDIRKQPDELLLRLVAELANMPTARFVVVEGVKYLVDGGDAATAKSVLMTNQARVMKKLHQTCKYENYDAYAASLGKWRLDRAARENAALDVGSELYHGTTLAAARIVRDSRLEPARPSFRGGAWDASRDGFLSMATRLTGATPGVILKMTLEADDVDDFAFKQVGITEVVTRFAILPERLSWALPVKGKRTTELDWKPLSELV